nr:hypothetical protein GCM10020063_033870 [Dactylosporangium thailandense]
MPSTSVAVMPHDVGLQSGTAVLQSDSIRVSLVHRVAADVQPCSYERLGTPKMVRLAAERIETACRLPRLPSGRATARVAQRRAVEDFPSGPGAQATGVIFHPAAFA